jgi:hypothetical protein
MLSKFDEELPILYDAGLRLGVCAMGDVAAGDELTAMRVWVWQKDGDKFAACSGNGGEHLGGHPLRPDETLPFTSRWMIQTELEDGSPEFSEGKPALAMAMALVTHEDGTDEVEQWNQAVMIEGRRNHEYPDREDYPEGEDYPER